MGLFGRRKEAKPAVMPVDPDEEKTRKMIEVASSIDEKIEMSDKKVAALEAKRKAYLEKAKVARKEKRNLEVQRLCISIKQCDENTKRQIAMGVKLTKLKNLCEQYLEQNDFIMSVTSATELMEKYGCDQAQAEKMMDKLQDLKDRNDEINETVMEGVEDDLADNEDILNEIDESNAEDAKKEAESALPSAPTTVHGGAVKKPTPAKQEKEEDLDGLLAELG
ncbi:hypothetical protein WA577_003764, partial [Blastocystis sp. JDR]